MDVKKTDRTNYTTKQKKARTQNNKVQFHPVDILFFETNKTLDLCLPASVQNESKM